MRMRPRVALFGTGVVALALLIFGVLLYGLVARSLSARQDEDLTARARDVVAALARASPSAFRSQPTLAPTDPTRDQAQFVEILRADGAPLSSTAAIAGAPPRVPADLLRAAARQGRAVASFTPVAGATVRAVAVPWQRPDLGLSGYVVVGQAKSAVGAQLNGTKSLLWVSAIASLLAAFGASWLVAGRALRPLRTVARTAAEIGETGDLDRRLPPVKARDEVGHLTASFNGMLDRLTAARDEIATANRRLAAALEAQRRFVADASHELRTPLTTIRANAGFLLHHPDGRAVDRREALSDIASETDRMSRLVGDLLTLARADAGQPLRRAPLDLAALARDVCRRAHAARPRRALRCEGTTCAPVRVSGDADALTQLLWILLDNADKHTPPDGEIRVRVEAGTETHLLRVRDEGTGIPPAELERIFERFVRSDAARAGDGAGLGLAIARWIVTEHGGTIVARNNADGPGATFTAELPAAD